MFFFDVLRVLLQGRGMLPQESLPGSLSQVPFESVEKEEVPIDVMPERGTHR